MPRNVIGQTISHYRVLEKLIRESAVDSSIDFTLLPSAVRMYTSTPEQIEMELETNADTN